MEQTLALVENVVSHKAEYVAVLEEKEALLEKMAHRNEKYLERLLKKKK